MTDMTEQQLIVLGERISEQGRDASLEDFLGAIGLVVFHCFSQYPPDDRMQAVAAWHGALFRQLASLEHKRKAN